MNDNTQNNQNIEPHIEPQKLKRPLDNLRYLIVAGLLGGLFLHTFIKAGLMNQTLGFLIPPAIAESYLKKDSHKKDIPIPIVQDPQGFLPDWSRITFEDMIFSEGGSISYPGRKGGIKTRIWEAGQSIAQIMEFGDFADTGLGIEELNLEFIASKLGFDLENISLADFALMEWQTLPDLIDAIPQLEKLRVTQVPPVQDFLKNMGIYGGNNTIGNILDRNPKLDDIPLSESINLEEYSITEIPGLEQVQIQNFAKWEDTLIGGVPGLNELPWSEFPRILSPTLAFVGKIDVPLKEVEANRTRSISGSDREGFNVPCKQNCAHTEIAGVGKTTGVQWISGKFQKVKGGFGPLKVVFDGKEPTGRHPFGKSFKQVVWNINEDKGTVETTMFFRVCKHIPFIGKTCTPYGIGPVPFITYREKDPIILGSPFTLPE